MREEKLVQAEQSGQASWRKDTNQKDEAQTRPLGLSV